VSLPLEDLMRGGKAALAHALTRLETEPTSELADITYPAMVLMQALFDIVIVETVGVGQSEMEIAALADATIFCAQPGSGDALQFMKAGIMEVPDLVLVTKGDMGEVAIRAASDIKGALSLTSQNEAGVEVVVVSAQSGQGVDQAIAAMRLLPARRAPDARAKAAQNWAREQVLRGYGRFGLELLKQELGNNVTPFGHTAGLLDVVGGQLQGILPSS